MSRVRRKTVTVRVPRDLAELATTHATAAGVTFPWLVARLLREWLTDGAYVASLTRRTVVRDVGDGDGAGDGDGDGDAVRETR